MLFFSAWVQKETEKEIYNIKIGVDEGVKWSKLQRRKLHTTRNQNTKIEGKKNKSNQNFVGSSFWAVHAQIRAAPFQIHPSFNISDICRYSPSLLTCFTPMKNVRTI
jgi:hypothetical protein